MKTTRRKKLALGRETLRTLGRELSGVRGGGLLVRIRTQICTEIEDSSQCSLLCPTETLSN